MPLPIKTRIDGEVHNGLWSSFSEGARYYMRLGIMLDAALVKGHITIEARQNGQQEGGN